MEPRATTWGDLYMIREMKRQRREAAVALQCVQLAGDDTERRRKAMVRALAVIVEDCPAMWGE